MSFHLEHVHLPEPGSLSRSTRRCCNCASQCPGQWCSDGRLPTDKSGQARKRQCSKWSVAYQIILIEMPNKMLVVICNYI